MINYKNELERLISIVPMDIVNFDEPRLKARIPTQVSSNFVTNKEQGDWAENLLLKAINECELPIVAVKYGKSDDIIAGDDRFQDFFSNYQIELDEIGKRPDILIFHKSDFQSDLGLDLSFFPHNEIIHYVKRAIAGVEIRSSAFLINKYEEAIKKTRELIENDIKNLIQSLSIKIEGLEESDIKKNFEELLNIVRSQNLNLINIEVPNYRSNKKLLEISKDFRLLRKRIKDFQKRDYLSITPKVEDLKLVKKWIDITGVPHFYIQVFFDKIYGISFIDILKLISNPNKENKYFSIESDNKNQNKTTIKINTHETLCIAGKVNEPVHESKRMEMNRGRLLFYVSFKGGEAFLDINNLKKLFNL